MKLFKCRERLLPVSKSSGLVRNGLVVILYNNDKDFIFTGEKGKPVLNQQRLSDFFQSVTNTQKSSGVRQSKIYKSLSGSKRLK